MRKRILVVGMLNSIHTAKWLRQFQDSELDIRVFPSAYFRNVHPLIHELTKYDTKCNFIIPFPSKIYGFLDYLSNRIFSRLLNQASRTERLFRTIKKFNPHIVHVLEFQHSGYLCLEVIEKYGKNFELISTNWGSDIYHYQQFENHVKKIQKLLSFSDKYSAECERDVILARKFGFLGEVLPVVPNSGGFSFDLINKKRSTSSTRNLVLIKSYGGYFGRANLVLEIIPRLLQTFPSFNFFFYSVTDELISKIKDLQENYQGKIDFSTVSNPISYSKMQHLFEMARVYIGCSISDGISTSFLEALINGAYPIQTKTSCAEEWLRRGAKASLVDLDIDDIYREIAKAMTEDEMVDQAQISNHKVALLFLESNLITKKVQSFY